MPMECILISAEYTLCYVDKSVGKFYLNGLQQLTPLEFPLLTQSLSVNQFVGWESWRHQDLGSLRCVLHKKLQTERQSFRGSYLYFEDVMPPLYKLIEFFTTKLDFSVVSSFSTRSFHSEWPDTLVWTLQRQKKPQ